MAHIHRAIDFTVGALIVFGGKVLLVHHRETGFWLTPGGHVELDEDTDQALLREIAEETGLGPDDVEIAAERPPFEYGKPLWTPRWVNIHPINSTHRHLALIYLVRAKTNRVTLAPEEHHAIRWFSSEELNDPALNTPSDIRFYGKEAIRLLT